ncbi:MAG: hypothetical protein RBS36_12555, partial [Thiomicrospira sp.]|nr:hypothetical protein [Thiomicrospira sp.]
DALPICLQKLKLKPKRPLKLPVAVMINRHRKTAAVVMMVRQVAVTALLKKQLKIMRPKQAVVQVVLVAAKKQHLTC